MGCRGKIIIGLLIMGINPGLSRSLLSPFLPSSSFSYLVYYVSDWRMGRWEAVLTPHAPENVTHHMGAAES